MFISFEGIEGSGKTTQARQLAARLMAQGTPVWLTREPGGTSLAEAIRAVVLRPDGVRAALRAGGLLPATVGEDDAVTPVSELLLMNAARAQLVTAIRRQLASGTVVICDRYADATRAYQGGGRGLDPAQVEAVIAVATEGLTPDLTILLDADPQAGLERKRGRATDPAEWNRLDEEDLAFHRRVRAAYLDLAHAHPARWLVLDGLQPPEVLAEQIAQAVDAHRLYGAKSHHVE